MDFGLEGSLTRRITELGNNITCIDTGYIRPQLAACYLIEEHGYAGIVETGTAYSVPTILSVLELKNIPPDNVLFVMPTHVHLDHAGGAGQLMQEFPQASLVIHPRGARHMIDPEKLWQGTAAVYGEEAMHRMYRELVPVPESRVISAEDNLVLDLAGRALRFIDTPGHARHHYSLYDERSRGFFSGDTFGMAYQELMPADEAYIMPTTTPVQFDPPAWYSTLERYLQFDPERMYLTHYGMVENVKKLAVDLKRRIEAYVEIALSCQPGPGRTQLMESRIAELTYRELRELGCPLPAAACKALLSMDIALNVQGLEVWLDKQ